MNKVLYCIAFFFIVIMTSCGDDPVPPPISNPDPYLNPYSGSYDGLFSETNNGVDSAGTFKDDTSYFYSMVIKDAGNYTISIEKGSIILPSIMVDTATGYFITDYEGREIDGHFIGDSVYIRSKTLNGSYEPPQWFVIQELSFAGKKHF